MVTAAAPSKAKAFKLAPWWKPKEAAENAEAVVEKSKPEAVVKTEAVKNEAVVKKFAPKKAGANVEAVVEETIAVAVAKIEVVIKNESEAVVEESAAMGIVVTREQFLARMPARGAMDDMEHVVAKPLDQVSASYVLPPGLEHIEPPPGLIMPTQEEPTIAQDPSAAQFEPEGAPAEDPPETIPAQDFKVLLRNLPDTICTEPMIWVMLNQASLDTDVLSISTRAGGKALITFSDFSSASQCMYYFHGWQWGMSDPVTALYVRTVATEKSNTHAFNATAPAFVPSGRMSADAPVFNPSSMTLDEMKMGRDRFNSSASTAVTTSDGVSEESEPDDEATLVVAA